MTPIVSRLLVAGGRDRLRFLHAVTAQDVGGLAPGQGAYGALMDDRAHPISDFRLYVLPHAALLELPMARAERAREALERRIVADDVTLAWAEGGVVAYESRDPARVRAALEPARRAAGAVVPAEAFFGDPSPGVAYRAEACTEPAGEWTEQALARVPAACAALLRASRLGGRGVAHVSAAPLEECARAAARGAVALLAQAQLDPLELAAGRPGDPELSAAAVWNELGLMEAVSLTKGCYMGQEIVQRVHAQGSLTRRLAGLVLETGNGVGWAGATLADAAGETAGAITRAARSPALERTLAFAFVRRGLWEPGTELVARRADGLATRAVVAALPFEAPAGARAAVREPARPREDA